MLRPDLARRKPSLQHGRRHQGSLPERDEPELHPFARQRHTVGPLRPERLHRHRRCGRRGRRHRRLCSRCDARSATDSLEAHKLRLTVHAAGMFPATASSNVTLANGEVVVSPLGGYQYVPLQTVGPTNNITLEPWTSCNSESLGHLLFASSLISHRLRSFQQLDDVGLQLDGV